ncbi:hypothetical protein QQS21_007371 [Conoideocrella luteorostrata]|uniref:NmrA-like domain-containing protein n=1 Tax=Conoideocrella luteorostrata TaxID=1105319 RepID=A0AAJ0CKV5_9HYPO|nr:hypothetical protein QQS21_007371 [Conoideocrella luteorostrata]
MSKTLAVFGATGNQGSSVVNHVLTTDLSAQYTIRAITRDLTSPASLALKAKNVALVQADVQDPSSLARALSGVHTVFAMTTPSFGPNAVEDEIAVAKNIVDAAVSQGVKYFIWSTLPNVREISGGKYTKVTAFDAKAQAEAYIRTLPIKSAFTNPGFFMENFHSQPFLGPKKQPDGTYVLMRNSSPTSTLPLIAAVEDSGKFVGTILANPDEYEGVALCASYKCYTWEEIVQALSKATGKKVVFKEVSDEEFGETLTFARDLFVEAYRYEGEFGNYGKDSVELVAWARERARGRLMDLDEFLEKNPLTLE